ncbi:MAG TPA: SPOR domain-containing protein [Nevskiaceae bacterium]|nr:SPOR domain-containing protein [Nevskiaceae bacterium]
MNEVLTKRLLGACVLVGATIVLANLLPSPQAVPPTEEHAKRVTYDLRPAPEVAKIEPPPPAPVAEAPTPAQAPVETPAQSALPIAEAPPKPAVAPKPKPKPAVAKAVAPPPKKKPEPAPPPVQAAEAAPVDASPGEPSALAGEPAQPAAESAPTTKQSWYLQIGVYSVEANAANSIAKLRKAGLQPHQGTISVKAGKVFRVRCGPFASQEEADQGKAKAVALGFKDARVARD